MKKGAILSLLVALGFGYAHAAFAHFYALNIRQLCKEAQESANLPDMIECAQAKLSVDDKRLNENYKKAMASAKDKKKLQASQRQWIKERDKQCQEDDDGGQAATLNHISCLQQETSQRADWLADFYLTDTYPRAVLEICLQAEQSSAMQDLINCTHSELEVDDKRLNENYKKAMARTKDKSALKAEQRQWIKERDAACKPQEDGGQNALLDEASCLRYWTIERAEQLAKLGSQ